MASINQALALAFAGMPASSVKRGVAEAAVSFAVLASTVRRADSEQEPVSQVCAEVGIGDGLASGVLGRWEEEGARASATIALEVASVVVGEQLQHFVPLSFGGLLGQEALHLWDGIVPLGAAN